METAVDEYLTNLLWVLVVALVTYGPWRHYGTPRNRRARKGDSHGSAGGWFDGGSDGGSGE